MKNAALIELGGSHDEVLYAQSLFLKKTGYAVELFASRNLETRTAIFDTIDKAHYYDVRNYKPAPIKVILSIWRKIRKKDIQVVVFNTCHGSSVRNFMLLPWGKKVLVGIAHNIDKIARSGNQRIISLKIKKYFVLNEYLLNNYIPKRTLKINHFYPIYFPDYQKLPLGKKPGEIWLTVPGLVEFKRRDYPGLFKAIQKEALADNVKILFLGRIGHSNEQNQINEVIYKLGLREKIILFDGYIDHATFHSYLEKSDLILPLLHPDTERFHEYSAIQISGAFNLAFAHRIPLLLDHFYHKYEIFKNSAIFYNENELIKTINHLAGNKNEIRKTKDKITKNTSFDFEIQRKNYIHFIES